MMLVKVAELEVSLVSELPVSDMPKVCWKIEEKYQSPTDTPRMAHESLLILSLFPVPNTLDTF